jgi:hypothetical protein
LAADQHLRWRQNSPRPIQYYLQLWPDALRLSPLLIDLLVDEFGYREESGEGISCQRYLEELSDLPRTMREEVAAAVSADASQPIQVRADHVASISPSCQLVYQIGGTTFVYLPDQDQDVFTAGRQRRGFVGGGGGCDLVIRCASSTKASLRISRKHLEVYRQGQKTFVVNRSTLGTERNGQSLARGVPTEIQAGDRLNIAGVVSLCVLHRDNVGLTRPLPTHQAAVSAEDGGTFVLEVSSGELLTTSIEDHVD